MATMRDVWPVEEKSTMSLAPEMTVARTADDASPSSCENFWSPIWLMISSYCAVWSYLRS